VNLNLRSSKETVKYFLTKQSKLVSSKQVDLVLSPEFYWSRTFEIPVKKPKQALAVLPTLFEEYLTPGNYSYYCMKQEESRFLCFAYDNEIIIEHIQKSGLSLSQVHRIFLAQTQMQSYDGFEIKGEAFEYNEGILVKLPKGFVRELPQLSNKLNIDHHEHKLDFKFYTHVFNKEYLWTLLIMVGLIAGLNILKYLQYQMNIQKNETKIQNVKQEYRLPKTNLQLNSILKGFQQKQQANTKFYEALQYVFGISKKYKKVKIIDFKYDKNILKITFAQNEEKWIKQYMKKKYGNAVFNGVNNVLTMQVQL
jgi:hypothetical protein